MNKDLLPQHAALQEWTQRQLQALPLQRAPEELSTRVWRQVRWRAALPWWRQPWRHWPGPVRALLVALGLVLGWALARLPTQWLILKPIIWLQWVELLLDSLYALQDLLLLLLRHAPIWWCVLFISIAALYVLGMMGWQYRRAFFDKPFTQENRP